MTSLQISDSFESDSLEPTGKPARFIVSGGIIYHCDKHILG